MWKLGKCEEEQTSGVHKQPDSQLFYFLECFSLNLSQTYETFTIWKVPSSLSPSVSLLWVYGW